MFHLPFRFGRLSSPNSPVRYLLLTGLLIAILFAPNSLQAQQDEEGSQTLAELLQSQQMITFVKVATYIDTHPEADDLPAACQWMFQTAQENGWEAEVVELADFCIKNKTGSAALQKLAFRTRALGWARSDKVDQAVAALRQELRTVSLRSPDASVNFALSLWAKVQVAGDLEAAREILDLLNRSLFLNTSVKRLCEQKLAKLALAGKPAPKITCKNFKGEVLSLSDLQGKVVIVDFWATNCAPCLAEFPHMKRLYKDFHSQGLEIVGISLDSSELTVTQFQEKQGLPWTMALSSSDQDTTRELYKVVTIPSLFVVDQTGKIAAVDLKKTDLRSLVHRLLVQKTGRTTDSD